MKSLPLKTGGEEIGDVNMEVPINMREAQEKWRYGRQASCAI